MTWLLSRCACLHPMPCLQLQIDVDCLQALLNVAAELVYAIICPAPCFPALTEMMGRRHLSVELWDAALCWDGHLKGASDRHLVDGCEASLHKLSFMRSAVAVGRLYAQLERCMAKGCMAAG